MNQVGKKVGLTAMLLSLVACGSTPKNIQISKDEATVQEIRDKAEQEQLKRKQALLEREVKTVPNWVVAPPRADLQGFYGVGIGSDSDMLNSMRKARLQGAYELARSMSAELSAEDTMTGSGQGQYRYVVDLFVNRVNVAGSEMVHQEVIPVNGIYKTYVLMKMPMGEFNQVLKSQASSAEKSELERGYRRLMKRVAESVPSAAAGPSAAPSPARVEDTVNAAAR